MPDSSQITARQECAGSLSPNQGLVWAGQKLRPNDPLYNVAILFRLPPAIDRGRFQKAFAQLVQLSDSLRTVVREEDGEPLRFVRDDLNGLTEFVELSDDEVRRWAAARCRSIFQLDRCLFDSVFLETESGRYIWYLCLHHLIADGWSFSVILHRMAQLYAGQTPSPMPAAELLEGDGASGYWRRKLEEPVEPVRFYGRQPAQGGGVNRVAHLLSAEETACIRNAAADRSSAKTADGSLFNLFTAVTLGWMRHAAGARRVALGATFHNRRRPELRDSVGLLMQVLPLIVEIEDYDTFLTLLDKAGAEAHAAGRHAPYALPNRPGAEIYHVLLNYDNAPFDRFLGEKVEAEWVHSGAENLSFGLQIRNSPDCDRMRLEFDFHEDVFPGAEAARAQDQFLRCLRAFLRDPEALIGGVDVLDPAERGRLLSDWSEGPKQTRGHETVVDLFEAQVRRTPDALAVACDAQSLTYADLNRQADRVAQCLLEKGAAGGTVGLRMQRSPDFVIGLLAILKAGAAFLPLDPADPPERVEFMLADARARLLLTQGGPKILGAGERNPDSLAYVIYTSGTSGTPKGVAVGHASLANYIQALQAEFGLNPADRVLQFSALAFDTSIEEIFGALVSGAALVLRTEAMAHSIEALLRACARWKITVLDLPTAYWHELVSAMRSGLRLPASVRIVYVGGEPLHPHRLGQWQDCAPAGVRLLNGYGPTETTIVATMCDLTAWRQPPDAEHLPIGRPVVNARAYILNESMQPTPVGVPGELYIGGMGLARGYLNRPELTAARFLPDPFRSDPGAAIYKTGDRARYLPDGLIEYCGRADAQSKIRGFRVEPAEVESALLSLDNIRQAAVITSTDEKMNKSLTAYLIADAPLPRVSELRAGLRRKLPVYMIPARFVFLTQMPLTASGKLDRRGLDTAPRAPEYQRAEPAGPRSEVESALWKIWSKEFGFTEIGMDDDFFELGGNSLLAIRIVASMNRECGGGLAVAQMFETPTIRHLSQAISARSKVQFEIANAE